MRKLPKSAATSEFFEAIRRYVPQADGESDKQYYARLEREAKNSAEPAASPPHPRKTSKTAATPRTEATQGDFKDLPSKRALPPSAAVKPSVAMAEVIHLRPLTTSEDIWTEQNLGCELPVCVSNRKHVKDPAITFSTDDGRHWRLERGVCGKLPAPEYYKYWLWFVDRCVRAAAESPKAPPWIDVNPLELFDLFGHGKSGERYRIIDDAFKAFAELRMTAKSAFYDPTNGRVFHEEAHTSLCDYISWREESLSGGDPRNPPRAKIRPGYMLWESVKADYVKSFPLEPIKDLPYVSQRLFTYISKHCLPGRHYTVNVWKMLPKIPLELRSNQVKTVLNRYHADLISKGFLLPMTPAKPGDPPGVEWKGRGKNLIVTYSRPS